MSNEKEKIVIENLENLTLDQAVEYHRILWRGIAEEIEKDVEIPRNINALKYKVFKTRFDSGFIHIEKLCFLCEYVKQVNGLGRVSCGSCPLYNNNAYARHSCLNGLYYDIDCALYNEDYGRAGYLALEIAELPVVNRKGSRM